jgi:hypothetical protein
MRTTTVQAYQWNIDLFQKSISGSISINFNTAQARIVVGDLARMG